MAFYNLLCLLCLAASGLVLDSPQQQHHGYKLVWSDEFNTDGPVDTTMWRFEHGFVRNGEDQWYQSGNAYCKDGLLIIEAKRVHRPNPWYQAGSHDWRKARRWINYTYLCQYQHRRAQDLEVRPLRHAREDRHESEYVAGILDPGRKRTMAFERRGGYHGILPRPPAGKRGAQRGKAVCRQMVQRGEAYRVVWR